jgi:lysyl endopeptidase
MRLRRLAAFLMGLLLVGAWPAVPVLAQQRPIPPSQQHSSVRASSAVAMQTLPSVDVAALRAEDRARSDRVGPYRFGTVLDTDLSPKTHGTWERLPSGRWLWRLRLRSRDAVSLSVGFSQFGLPEGADLYLHGPGETVVRGPYTAADATAGQHWTPLVRGERLILELEVPANRRQAVSLVIGHVTHGYRALPTRRDGTRPKSGTCNLDVACEEADPWRDQVNAVGGYTLRRGQDQLFCTGVLMNSTAQDPRLLFLTAEHCVQTPSQAASMVFYWNFQTAQCRRQGTDENGTFPRDSLDVGAWNQTSSGARLRARYGNVHEDGKIEGKPDLTLVEVDTDTIPASYDLYQSGWSREDAPTQESVTIHHPSGHGKRISFDENASRITGWAQPTDGTTHLRIGDWETGTTESGSSGAPLFDKNRRVVGVLSGGLAGCGGDGDTDDNNEPDWYGRLAAGFNQGDYQGDTIADWLDPANTGAMEIEGQALVPDSIPPAQPPNFRVTNVSSNSVTLRWTAPGDDSTSGTASEYLLRRRAEAPIRTRADFERAQPVSNVPAPKPAGSSQSVTVSLDPGKSYYFGLVALDKVKNASPLATTDRDATPVSTLRVLTPPAPNPTRHQSTFNFVVEKRQRVRIELYDTLGRRVRVLMNEEVQPFRRQTLTTDVSSLSSGVYFVRIRGASTVQTARIAVTK